VRQEKRHSLCDILFRADPGNGSWEEEGHDREGLDAWCEREYGLASTGMPLEAGFEAYLDLFPPLTLRAVQEELTLIGDSEEGFPPNSGLQDVLDTRLWRTVIQAVMKPIVRADSPPRSVAVGTLDRRGERLFGDSAETDYTGTWRQSIGAVVEDIEVELELASGEGSEGLSAPDHSGPGGGETAGRSPDDAGLRVASGKDANHPAPTRPGPSGGATAVGRDSGPVSARGNIPVEKAAGPVPALASPPPDVVPAVPVPLGEKQTFPQTRLDRVLSRLKGVTPVRKEGFGVTWHAIDPLNPDCLISVWPEAIGGGRGDKVRIVPVKHDGYGGMRPGGLKQFSRDVAAAIGLTPNDLDPDVPPGVAPPSKVRPITLAELRPEPRRWVWEGGIACGALNTVHHPRATDATPLLARVIAAVSSGSELPGQEGCRGGDRVLLLADNLGDASFHESLSRAGADLENVVTLGGGVGGAAYDFRDIEDMLRIHVRLVVVNPLSRLWRGSRKGLDLLRTLAEKFRAAFLLVVPTNSLGRADERLDDAVRSGLALAPPPDGRGGLVLALRHTRLGVSPPSLHLIDQGGGRVGFKDCELTADQLVRPGGPRRSRQRRQDAVEFLLELLRAGAMLQREVAELARREGYTDATLRRAKAQLAINSVRQDNSPRSPWVWSLPAVEDPVPADARWSG
jgi:hypothetical protein